jgi:hypothetical protein
VAGVRGEVAVVDRRVGVLLRVEHPHETSTSSTRRSTSSRFSRRVLSWSGRSSRTRPCSAGSGSGCTWRRGTSSQSSRRSAAPRRHAATPSRGRRRSSGRRPPGSRRHCPTGR